MDREKKIYNLKSAILVALFSVIIFICSRIAIPTVIPFTLQSLGVFLSLSILGGKRGLLAICLYISMGFIGLPISASGESAFALFVGPTAGYFIGWLLCGVIFWLFEAIFGSERRIRLISLAVGTLICYISGMLWFLFAYSQNLTADGVWFAFYTCVIPFIAVDALKLFVADKISEALHKRVQI